MTEPDRCLDCHAKIQEPHNGLCGKCNGFYKQMEGTWYEKLIILAAFACIMAVIYLVVTT